MKRVLTILCSVVFLCCVFTGCSDKPDKSDNGKITAYATIYPVYDFACKIGGDMAEVKSIIPKGTEVHEWEPTAADIVNISKADILFYNGIGLEGWVESVQKSLGDDAPVFVCVTDGLDTIIEDAQADPHMWLSPALSKGYISNIAKAFISADEKNADYYNENLNKYNIQLESLDNEYKEALEDVSQKNIITVHKAYGYLCNEYGLNQIAAEGAVADSEPDAATLAKIIDFAKQNNIKTVFDTKNESSKVAKTLADEIGAQVKAISNLENLTDEEESEGNDYFSVMKSNLETLKEALK